MKLLQKTVESIISGAVEKSMSPVQFERNAMGSAMDSLGLSGVLANDSLLKSYSNMPHLRATVEKISSSVAETRWYLKERGVDYSAMVNKSASDMPVPDGGQAFLDFWNNGNKYMTGFMCKKLAQTYMELIGEYYIFLNFKSGSKVPYEYYILKPTWVSQNEKTGKYTVSLSENSLLPKMENVDREDLIRVYSPDPQSPMQSATSIAKALADEIATDEEASKYLKAFFINGASPEAIISIPGATDSQLTLLRTSWNQQNQGSRKRHSVHFVPGNINYHKIQQGLDELRMVELRQYQRNTIIQSYGVPPEMLGIIENSNRSTIAGAEWIYMKTVVIPRLELIKAEIQSKIINRFFDSNLILEFESPLPKNEEIIRDIMKDHPHCFTADEIRAAAYHPPLKEGGDAKVPMPNSNPKPNPIPENLGKDSGNKE